MANKLSVQFNDRQTKSLEDMADALGTTKSGVLKTALQAVGGGHPGEQGWPLARDRQG